MDADDPIDGDGRSPEERLRGRRNALLIVALALLLAGAGPYLLDRLRHPYGAATLAPLPGETIDMRSVPVNRATAAELETLPGIGPSLAARLVEDRSRRGSFRDAADLERVNGIGPALARKVAPYLLFD
jgi:competence ComEA-like helix-hairpin-helix protein